MAKTKNIGKSDKKGNSLPIVYIVLLVVLCIFSGVLIWVATKQASLIGKYELLEKIDNQACRYLDNQSGVNGSFDLNLKSPSDKPKLIYECFTGEIVKAKKIHGKSVGKYSSGASVYYFSSNQEAEKFAEKELNPLRYWGVDEEGQNNGIPQTSRFTFIVSDEKVPYFDAYTVKANAVLRVSLPCSDSLDACDKEATKILDRELKGINVL